MVINFFGRPARANEIHMLIRLFDTSMPCAFLFSVTPQEGNHFHISLEEALELVK